MNTSVYVGNIKNKILTVYTKMQILNKYHDLVMVPNILQNLYSIHIHEGKFSFKKLVHKYENSIMIISLTSEAN